MVQSIEYQLGIILIFEENNKAANPRIKDLMCPLFGTLNKIQADFGLR